MGDRAVLAKYGRLVDRYQTGELSVEAFHDAYLEAFKAESADFDEETYQILNDMFLEVEAYCPIPDLEGEIDEEELWIAARETQIRIGERLRRLHED